MSGEKATGFGDSHGEISRCISEVSATSLLQPTKLIAFSLYREGSAVEEESAKLAQVCSVIGSNEESVRSGPSKGGLSAKPCSCRLVESAQASAVVDQNVVQLGTPPDVRAPVTTSQSLRLPERFTPELIERKVKGLLDELEAENYKAISSQIHEWINKSASDQRDNALRLVTKLICEHATDGHHRPRNYALLSHELWLNPSAQIDDVQTVGAVGEPMHRGELFRKYMLNRCQERFENGWKHNTDVSASTAEQKMAKHGAALKDSNISGEVILPDEHCGDQYASRRGLALVAFVGELFKIEMISTKVIHSCVVKLLSNVINPDKKSVLWLCVLLKTVGRKLEVHPKMAEQVQLYMRRMEDLTQSQHVSPRLKRMVQVSTYSF